MSTIHVNWEVECEIIHNHFTCPECKTNNAETSQFCEISSGDEFKCLHCGAEFVFLEMSPNVAIDGQAIIQRKELCE